LKYSRTNVIRIDEILDGIDHRHSCGADIGNARAHRD
jgi:hypothetical protein